MCRNSNYFEHSIRFIYAVTGCLSITAFASLVGTPVRITNSAVGLKMCPISAAVKKCKSVNKKTKKKYYQIALLEKPKLHTIEFLIPKALFDSYISQEYFFQ